MSHQIDMSNNRANMAYVGDTPWHGLGQQLQQGATIEQWQEAAGLNWWIQKRPISFPIANADGSKALSVIENRFAHVRSDTQECIGMGSNQFQLVQPGDTLEFYRDLVDGSHFTIETAGSLKNGAKLWALARCDMDLRLGDGSDLLKPYLLLATANDGTMSTVADFTTVRVVCRNTLSMAVGDNGGKASIKVPHSRKFDADAVKAELGLIDDRLQTFADNADTLTQTGISDEQAIEFFFDLYAKTDERGNVTNEKNAKAVLAKLMRLYRSGPGADLAGSRGTAWGAVNAVTNYVDFTTRARSDENRFNSGQFGIGAQLKQLAFDNALKIAA